MKNTKVLVEVKGDVSESDYKILEQAQKDLTQLGVEFELIGSRPKDRG